jgi:hypothetical protein
MDSWTAKAEAKAAEPEREEETTPSEPDVAAAAARGEEETAPDEGAEPALEAEPESEPEADKLVHGNAKTRLSDGTVVAVADLKKSLGKLREYEAKLPDLSAYEQRVRAQAAELAQQQQLLQRALPVALETARSNIPPPPDQSLLQTDPIAHYEQMQAHQAGVMRVRQMEAAAAARNQHVARQQQVQFESYLAEQSNQLADKIPDVRDPAKRETIQKGFVDTAGRYGFSAEEVNSVYDHRLLHMVHDLSAKAAAYDKLIAKQGTQKQVAQQKAQNAVPVAAPQRRVTQTETKSEQKQELMKRVRATGGDLREVAAAYAQLNR